VHSMRRVRVRQNQPARQHDRGRQGPVLEL
jgi:hypothetical protein